MKLRVDGDVHRGPAIDLRNHDRSNGDGIPRESGPGDSDPDHSDTSNTDLTPARLEAAIHDPASPLVDCPPPGPLHDHITVISPDRSVPRRPVLAAVARSHGGTSSYNVEIRALEAEYSAIEPPAADVPAAVESLTAAREAVDGLRDDVARLGGTVAASDAGAKATAQAELRAAAARLAEAETELVAAEQHLARERDRQRAANDARERRLVLRDRLENRRRDARTELANSVRDRVGRALNALPPWPAASEDARFALAAVRAAAMRAPVVVANGPFRTAVQARGALAAPVVLV